MPELPDLTVYVEAMERALVGNTLERVRVVGPALMRTAVPPLPVVHGRRVVGVERLGKRLVVEVEGDLFLVIHLMIAGRLRWRPPGANAKGRAVQAAFDLDHGTLILTEAATRKRASLHLVEGRAALATFDAGGIEPLACSADAFAQALRRENRTMKRALTDPRIVAGIGNAYSDEILHRARLSPMQRTHDMDDDALARLHGATRAVLSEWTARLRAEAGGRFPEKVTAFRPGMAVHGRFREPCPECRAPVQRIVYAENEANYCPACQTGGRLLADRALSTLMRGDWPRTLSEMEERWGAPKEMDGGDGP